MAPLEDYLKGHGKKVMKNTEEYGKKKKKTPFYASANKDKNKKRLKDFL